MVRVLGEADLCPFFHLKEPIFRNNINFKTGNAVHVSQTRGKLNAGRLRGPLVAAILPSVAGEDCATYRPVFLQVGNMYQATTQSTVCDISHKALVSLANLLLPGVQTRH